MTPSVITIDGPAGTGKSTVALRLAERLGFEFLNTGAMYRAVAWKCLHKEIDLTDEQAVLTIAREMTFSVANHKIHVNGIELGEEIRKQEIATAASIVAAIGSLRDILVEHQRSVGSQQSIVTEGRDQGTIVFPDAHCKFFLTARPEVRARRRYEDLADKAKTSVDEILRQQNERDKRDQERAVAPLKPAEDAEIVDSSDLEIDVVVKMLVSKVQAKTKK